MKLKCDDHNRRVVAVGGRILHRTGDGSPCSSKILTIGPDRYSAGELVLMSEGDPGVRLLRDLFGPAQMRNLRSV